MDLLLGLGHVVGQLAQLDVAGDGEGRGGHHDGHGRAGGKRAHHEAHLADVGGARGKGGHEQRQHHGRLHEHAHEQLADAADARVGVGAVHGRQREEEARQGHEVDDGDDVAEHRDGTQPRDHGHAARQPGRRRTGSSPVSTSMASAL